MTAETAAPRCLVLGGSGALGRVVSQTLLERGARVALTYHERRQVAEELRERFPAIELLALDLASIADVERVVDEAAGKLSGLDALVQCAGVGTTVEFTGATVHHLMADIDESGWDRMFDVNVKGTFFACRRLIEVMEDGGNIVLTGSIDGVKPVPAPVHYAASKGALGGMAQAMAKELGEHGIRVNVVAPGILESGLSEVLPQELRDEYLKHCGLRRLGQHDEVANLIAWLAVDNTYLTGQTLLVDGAL